MEFLLSEADWLEYSEIYCPANGLLKEPRGTLCLVDGIACETFRQDVEEILDARRTDMRFAAEFKAVRTGVEQALKTHSLVFLRKQDFVRSQSQVGMTVEKEAGWVSYDNFKKHFGAAPGDPGVTAELLDFPWLMRPDNRGTVLDFPLPADLPHESIKTWATSKRMLDNQILGPTQIFRSGQALDRYKISADGLQKSRPKMQRKNGQ